MIFHLGKPPETSVYSRGSGWVRVSMPEMRRWQLMAFPAAVISMCLVSTLWLLLTPAVDRLRFISFPLPVLGFIACLVGVLIFHEFIHSWAHPAGGFSQQSIIGFYPSRMLLYSIFNGEVSRNRFLVVLIMPFVMISLVPFVIAAVSQTFSFWVAYGTLLNAFVSAGDILEIFAVLKQVPKRSRIRRDGWSYYWNSG